MSQKKSPRSLFNFGNVKSASELRDTLNEEDPSPPQTSPRSALGQLAQRTARATVEELQTLRDQIAHLEGEQREARDHGDVVFELPIDQIVLPEEYNRETVAYTDDAFNRLVESLREHGQDTPAKVLPLDDGRFELVSGMRRYHACRLLGRPLRVLVAPAAVDARERALEKWRENEEREDWSPIERARLFQDWLDQTLFPSQKALAESLQRPASFVSRHLSLLDIPEPVLSAFTDCRVLSVKQGVPIARACSKPEYRDVLIELAGELRERTALSDEQRLSILSQRARALLTHKPEPPPPPSELPVVEVRRTGGRPVLAFRPDIPQALIEQLAEEIAQRLECLQNEADS